jgi:protein subunit release factor B
MLPAPQKMAAINARLNAMGVVDADLREEFIKGSGKGGQKINKTSSCVQLTYLKTGLVIRCQETRSRELNRFLARRILAEKLEQERLGRQSFKEKLRHKIRAQKKKRSKRAKEKMLGDKRRHAEKKTLRRRPLLTN